MGRNQNKAGARLLMACLLAKIHNPEVDIRKPYTKITGDDAYSGRHYDESYIAPFAECNENRQMFRLDSI